MELLTFIFAVAAVIGIALNVWGKYTKSGRKWIEGEA